MCIRDSLIAEYISWLSPTVPPGESILSINCLLYTSDAADDLLCVDLGGRRIIKNQFKIEFIRSADSLFKVDL